jgi:hypothetical protein
MAGLFFVSCVDLAHIHHYALISENEMGRVIGAGYDFRQACLDRCQLNAMRSLMCSAEINVIANCLPKPTR